VEGWKGTLTAWQINVDDIRPISCDRFHLPPSAHSTFVAQNFIVVSFLPRPLETGDKDAMKVPFFHSNIDFDEVIFYHSGDFFSRSGITEGMITFHPQGIHHGPHKNAMEKSKSAQRTDEIAVMIDTKNPLFIADGSEKVEYMDYWKSWGNYNVK
jgi:homogentisate 1,2-dioxygenase